MHAGMCVTFTAVFQIISNHFSVFVWDFSAALIDGYWHQASVSVSNWRAQAQRGAQWAEVSSLSSPKIICFIVSVGHSSRYRPSSFAHTPSLSFSPPLVFSSFTPRAVHLSSPHPPPPDPLPPPERGAQNSAHLWAAHKDDVAGLAEQ